MAKSKSTGSSKKKEVKSPEKAVKKARKTRKSKQRVGSASGIKIKSAEKSPVKRTTDVPVKKKTEKKPASKPAEARVDSVKKNASNKRISSIKKSDVVKKILSKQKNKNTSIAIPMPPDISTESSKKAPVDKETAKKGLSSENIIEMKRKMHRDIFMKCLEKKLFSSLESWDDDSEYRSDSDVAD